jgi:hypothetical protein
VHSADTVTHRQKAVGSLCAPEVLACVLARLTVPAALWLPLHEQMNVRRLLILQRRIIIIIIINACAYRAQRTDEERVSALYEIS